MTWEADYNVIAPADGNLLDLIGWVTMDNRSGKTFEHARIQLMAGDVSKIEPRQYGGVGSGMGGYLCRSDGSARPSTSHQKPFDEYQLYTLERATTLRDRETKQVEFVRTNNVITAKRIYVYDGSRLDPSPDCSQQTGITCACSATLGGSAAENTNKAWGHAGIQELPTEPSRNPAAQGQAAHLPAGRVRRPAVCR